MLTIQPGTGYVKSNRGWPQLREDPFIAHSGAAATGIALQPSCTDGDGSRARQRGAHGVHGLDDSPPASIRHVDLGAAELRQSLPRTRDRARGARAFVQHPAVRAAMDAGVPNVIKTATNIGVESRLQPYPSISLGSFEVTPLEIAYAYSVFANLGV